MDKNIQTAFRCFTLCFIIVILALATEQLVLKKSISRQSYNDQKLLEIIPELVSAGVLSKSDDDYLAELDKKKLSDYLSTGKAARSTRRRRAIYMQLVRADRQGAIIVEKDKIRLARGATNINDPHITMAIRKRKRGKFLARNYEILAGNVTDERGRYSRVYPLGPELFNVIGYSKVSYGRSRLEDIYNDFLIGKQKKKWYLPFYTSRSPVADVVLTIDSQLQKYAYDALGEHAGAIVVLDVETGAILAMVSKPSFDPSSPAGKEWIKAGHDEKNKQFRNRAFEEIYPPGSTFKTVTASTALMNPDVIDAEKTINCDGYYNKYKLRCHHPHEEVDLSSALILSCNAYFADIACQLGVDKLRETASKFGFGVDRKHPQIFDLLPDDPDKQFLTESSYSIPYDLPPHPGLIAQSGIGQYEVRTTPLQMAMVAAAIANSGTVMKPFLVKEIRKSANNEADVHKLNGSWKQYQPGKVIKTYSPQKFGQAVSPEVAAEITKMMIGVMENGTGKWLKKIYKTEEGKYIVARKTEGTLIKIAGKTGTAETAKSKPTHSWFVAFAPADTGKTGIPVKLAQAGNPRIAVCVLAEYAGWGATVAGPIAVDVLAAALNQSLGRSIAYSDAMY